jgi:hypothetical protein
MKNLIHKLYQSEKLLALVGLLFFIGGIFIVSATIIEPDTDGDTVTDSIDLCPQTIVDKPVEDQSVNRHIWIGGEYFTVLVSSKGDKNKIQSEYSMQQTRGCSCMDIVNVLGKKNDMTTDMKSGCTNGTLGNWIKSLQ